MSRATPVRLLVLSLVIATGAAAQPSTGKRGVGGRLIELGAESSRAPPELRISPNLSTVILFDMPPSSAQVDEPWHFRRVRVAGDTLTIVPAEGLPVGTRVTLTMHFQDGQVLERTALVLVVVDEASAERQVEVHRHPRPQQREPMTVEALREENQQLRQSMEALREENRRLLQEMDPLLLPRERPGAGGLGELFAGGPLKAGDLAVRSIDFTHANLPKQPLQVRAALTYRLGSQMALLLELENTSGARPWQVREATLEDTEGTGAKALSVWVDARLGPGERGHIVLGAKALRKATRGPFTLRLQDSEGGQTVTLSNIVFP